MPVEPLWRPLRPLSSEGGPLVVPGGGGPAPGMVRLPISSIGALSGGADWYAAPELLAWVVVNNPQPTMTLTVVVARQLVTELDGNAGTIDGFQTLATLVAPAAGVGVSIQTIIPPGGAGSLAVFVTGAGNVGNESVTAAGGTVPIAVARVTARSHAESI